MNLYVILFNLNLRFFEYKKIFFFINFIIFSLQNFFLKFIGLISYLFQ
jgi:hypothetical protein